VDIRKNPIEFATYEYELFPRGGILYNEEAKAPSRVCTRPGMSSSGHIGAAVFGWIAGENAAAFARAPSFRSRTGELETEGRQDLFEAIRSRTGGPDWREANVLLQQVMWDYAGLVRSETLLEAGSRVLLGLREKARKTLVARNSHELMRALEVLNMIELAADRIPNGQGTKRNQGKNTSGRITVCQPAPRKLLVVRKDDTQPRLEWRKIKR